MSHHGKKTFDENVIVATAMVLLVAGYDTTGTTLSWACYALSKYQKVQDRLKAEIDEVVGRDIDKDISYDDLQSMTYLDQVICETLRLYNIASILKRSTTKDYKVPGHDLTIPKDTLVWVNVIGIHLDPMNYPEPDVFNPDHFSKEAKAKRNP